MKIFVGLELDAPVVEGLETCVQEMRRRAARLAPHARLSWVSADRFHVTVRFIGHVDAARGSAVATALAPALDQSTFTMRIHGVGAFPTRGAPRVLWAGVQAPGDALPQLERRVTDRLAACGVPREERPYHPHVTMARVQEAAGLRAAALIHGHDTREFGQSAVGAITLFESRPSSGGVQYIALQRTPLTPR